MSLQCWHIYGYGVNLSELSGVSFRRVVELVRTTHKYAIEFDEWLSQLDIDCPIIDDLDDFDCDYGLGLATVLREVVLELENIELTACDDFDGNRYLLFEVTYPWRMSDLEKSLKEEDIKSLMVKYLSQITDEAITIDYYGPENGG